MKKTISFKFACVLMAVAMFLPLATGLFAAAEEPGTAIVGDLGAVRLITGEVLEVEFSAEVLTNADAQATFTVLVDGEPVGWEYMSYFAFGPYAAKPIVNIRLDEALDAGEPRGRRRETQAEAYLARTENVRGPAAAARITVIAAAAERTPIWVPFYTERSYGHMSRVFAYVSSEGGTNGQANKTTSGINDRNISASMAEGRYPLYSDEFIARQMGEGVHRFFGRSEYLALAMVRAGFKSLIVGAEQSVYEAPEFRELYKHGETDDVYTRKSIKATEVPGNFDPVTGYFKRPFIVGTSDDVMRHDTPINAAGERIFNVSTAGVITPIAGVTDTTPARPRSDHFYYGEAFFDIFYELGVIVGSRQYPLGATNNWDDNRYDVHIERAYQKALDEGRWPNTDMIKSAKDYYVYGSMVFLEFIPESQEFQAQAYPVNTRAEMYEYDYDLYWALSGIHGKYEYWTGVGNLQGASTSGDTSKWQTPWFWGNQPDNFGPPAEINGTVGVPYDPLYITHVEVTSSSQLMVYFNREIRTRANVVASGNWQVRRGESDTAITLSNASGVGYTWKSIRLTTSGTTLDNGRPYGRSFSGFTRADIDERSVAAGGWIANNQAVGANALQMGEFVDLDEAIARGAGIRTGGVRVQYTGNSSAVRDWDGNELARGWVNAEFRPWIGVAYRTPLTGLYVYLDTSIGTNPKVPYNQRDVAINGGLIYETLLQNNQTITYPNSAAGILGWNGLYDENGEKVMVNGYVSAGLTSGNGPVEYDRTGQRIADYAVRQGGGMLVPAGSVLGNHAGRQPNSTGVSGTNMGDNLRVEGWGGTTFQSEDVLVMRDFNLCRYKNECLILHEGGHGLDSFTPSGSYARYANTDLSTAHSAAIAYNNGRRWYSVDNVGSYAADRSEMFSTGATFITSTMRESFQGNNDGTWTAVNVRESFYRYDPFCFEAYRRITWNGELGLWYENKVGDPAYRVMLEDWEVLRDQNEEFAHWTQPNDLYSWGASITEVAYHNPYAEARNNVPYGSQINPFVRWVSWNVPNVWDVMPTKLPTNPSFPNNRFDFEGYDFTSGELPAGGNPYYPLPEIGVIPVDELQPLKVQTHPFFRPGGVKRPVRPPELQALAEPVTGEISNVKVTPMRPIVVEFELKNFSGEVTNNNAQTSFDFFIDGMLTHFSFWTFKAEGDTAKVEIRLDRPLEVEEFDLLTVSLRKPIEKLAIEAPAQVTIPRGGRYTFNLTTTPEDALRDGLEWSVGNETFATVNDDGLVIAKNLPGTTFITVAAPSGASAVVILRII